MTELDVGAATGPPKGGPRRVRTRGGPGVPLPLLLPALIGLAFLIVPLVALLV
ncbi:molybdate ABC transporter permease subunit, partial [Streptomyces sp. SID7834]|nr:molybdate ABC transporter permease subunit [Streptomyces sp. SID7834]